MVEIAPGTSVADHFHRHCTEVFHIVGGQGRFVIDGRTFDLRSGDTLTCEPGEIHSTHNDHDGPFIYVVFKTNVVSGDIVWTSGCRGLTRSIVRGLEKRKRPRVGGAVGARPLV